MGKAITFLLFSVAVSALFVTPRKVSADCDISAPDSAGYNSTIQVTITGHDPGWAPETALVVFDSDGNQISCIFAGPGNTIPINMPNYGAYVLVVLESRECEGGLCFHCGPYIAGPYCAKQITLTGTPAPSPFCKATFIDKDLNVRVVAENLSLAENTYCYKHIDASGTERTDRCLTVQPDGTISFTLYSQSYWGTGIHPIRIRKFSNDEVVTSCFFVYNVTTRDPCYNYQTGVLPSQRVNRECAECLGKSPWSGPDEEDLTRPNIGLKHWTALGCISSKPEEFIATLIRVGFGIGGGIAFLFLIVGAFKFLTSEGNPEAINNGRQMIVNAIAGLVLIIFSVIVLKIIGVDVLELPGFVKP